MRKISTIMCHAIALRHQLKPHSWGRPFSSGSPSDKLLPLVGNGGTALGWFSESRSRLRRCAHQGAGLLWVCICE